MEIVGARGLFGTVSSPPLLGGTQEENSPYEFDFAFIATHLVKMFFSKVVKNWSKNCRKVVKN